jgi:hypothetical protein
MSRYVFKMLMNCKQKATWVVLSVTFQLVDSLNPQQIKFDIVMQNGMQASVWKV